MDERDAKHQLSQREFKFVTQLVYDRTGIVLGEQKREMVYRRLMRRIRELNLGSFSDYCRLLEDESGTEMPNFINSITTNLTSFFRESHHFDYLKDVYIPNLISSESSARNLKVWSAACSTGEEPYSLSMTLNETMKGLRSNWGYKILATDLDTEVLNKGRTGVYELSRVTDLPAAIKKRWFLRGKGSRSSMVRVRPELADAITFRQLNLLEPWPIKGPFDVIMCRNVLIYFDRPTQHKLVKRFVDLLAPGGLLMLGHSESLAKGSANIATKGRTIFQKPGRDVPSRSLG